MNHDPLDNLTNVRIDPEWPGIGDLVRVRSDVTLSPLALDWLSKNGIDRNAVATVKAKRRSQVTCVFKSAKDPEYEWYDQANLFEPA